MYLDFKVDIPIVKGKITYREKAGTAYVYYELLTSQQITPN